MVSLPELKTTVAAHPEAEYVCQANLNVYDSPSLEKLATQAVAGRQLRILALPPALQRTTGGDVSNLALPVRLAEDDYEGWLAAEDIDLLDVAESAYEPVLLSEMTIRDRLPQVIQYTHQALSQPNVYLWGGTVGPNYDCSGLMQAAFLAAGIWIPRDAYQQHAFVPAIALEKTQPGDLVFFGNNTRITHVGLYLGDRRYIHSSGRQMGRNGIGLDILADCDDAVSSAYYRQFRGCGRVVRCYQPGDRLISPRQSVPIESG